MKTSIVWFRHDLRLKDNPALNAVAKQKAHLVPLFIWAPNEEKEWAPGAASKWWLHYSLDSLTSSLKALGYPLIIKEGSSLNVLTEVVKQTKATSVFWNKRFEPHIIERDLYIEKQLRKTGVVIESFNGNLLHEPSCIKNKSGKPFKVFTPFFKHCIAHNKIEEPLQAFRLRSCITLKIKSTPLKSLNLLPKIPWDKGLRESWKPGETNAQKTLNRFLKRTFSQYSTTRNLPFIEGTSRLSPHLHFGEISPRQIWYTIENSLNKKGIKTSSSWKTSQYVAELYWREFSHHLLFHFPHTASLPLREEFSHFPWNNDQAAFKLWTKGLTGYPIVDAGMRELWHTGWMHNRVRMIVASFLVKDLLIPWQKGAQWFWDTLVDADLAQNTLGWQWTAGCGADAAPYFRIFNPISQGEKFDPDGIYVKKWVPELKMVPTKFIHRPHEWDGTLNYTSLLVDHGDARSQALKAYDEMKSRKSG